MTTETQKSKPTGCGRGRSAHAAMDVDLRPLLRHPKPARVPRGDWQPAGPLGSLAPRLRLRPHWPSAAPAALIEGISRLDSSLRASFCILFSCHAHHWLPGCTRAHFVVNCAANHHATSQARVAIGGGSRHLDSSGFCGNCHLECVEATTPCLSRCGRRGKPEVHGVAPRPRGPFRRRVD
jgi:hypothetical protein